MNEGQTAGGGVAGGASTGAAQSYEAVFRETSRCINGLKASNLTGSAITYTNDLERNLHQLAQVLDVNPSVWTPTNTKATATAPI